MQTYKILLNQLNRKDLTVERRLTLARNAFLSSNLPGISYKEETILKWMCEQMLENTNNKELILGCEQLFSELVCSQHMTNLLSADFTLQCKTDIIEAIIVLFNTRDHFSHCFYQSVCSLFDNEVFVNEFKKNVAESISLLGAMLKVYPGQSYFVDIIINIIIKCCKNKQQEFKDNFINDCLILFINYFQNSKCKHLQDKFIKCLQLLLYYKLNVKQILDYNNQGDDGEDSQLKHLLQLLHNVNNKQHHVTIMSSLYYYVFKAFVVSFNKDHKLIYKYFLILYNILMDGDTNSKKWNNNTYTTLATLVKVLSEFSIDKSVCVDDNSLSSWLKQLVMKLLDSKTLTSEQIDVLVVIIEYTPLVAESNFTQILSCLHCSHDEGDKLIVSLLLTFNKLQRINQFITGFLSSLSINNIDRTGVIVEHVSNIVPTLPSSQSAALFKILVNNFELHCIVARELNTDHIQVVCKLLLCYMSSTRLLAELDCVKLLLGKFATRLLSTQHNTNTMLMLLKLCYTWGEVTIIKYEYTNTNQQHLSAAHDYINDGQWNVITERVANFGSEECQLVMIELILQKMKLLNLTNNTDESLVKYLSVCLSSGPYQTLVTKLKQKDISLLINNQTRDMSYMLLTNYVQQYSGEDLSSVDNEDKFVLSLVPVIIKTIYHQFNNTSVRALGDLFEDNISEDHVKQQALVCNQMLNTTKLKHNKTMLNKCVVMLSKLPYQFIGSSSSQLKDSLIVCLILVSVCCRDSSLSLLSFNMLYDIMCYVKYLDWDVVIMCLSTNKSSYHLLTKIVDHLSDSHISAVLKNNCNMEPGVRTRMLSLLLNNLNKRPHDDEQTDKFVYKKKKEISKRLLNILQSETDSVDSRNLLQGYTTQLDLACCSSNSDQVTQIIAINFGSYLDYIMNQPELNETCNEFINVITKHSTMLDEFVTDINLNDSLIKLIATPRSVRDSSVELFCNNSTSKQYCNLMTVLLNQTKICLNSCDPYNNLSRLLTTWRHCMNVAERSKQIHSLSSVDKLFTQLVVNINIVSTMDIVCSFILFCINNKQLKLTTSMLDTTLDILNHIQWSTLQHQQFHQLYSITISIVTSLISMRTPLILDRVQVVYQLYNRHLQALVDKCSEGVGDGDGDDYYLTSCAFHFEKLTNQIVKKRDFSRVSSYFIIDILHCIDQTAVQPAVKIHLKNSINNLLSVCDQHSITYMLRVLPPSCQNIFSVLYKQYNSHYKFVGKI